MQIYHGATPSVGVRRPATAPSHQHPPGHEHPPGHGSPSPHHGGISMEAVHIAHDVAMIGMNLPGPHHGHGGHAGHAMGFDPNASICGTSRPEPPKPGTFDAFTNGTRVNQGLTVLSAAASAGATYHGVQMVRDGHYAHGANHILMGAGTGTMALAMATGSHGLHQASSVLMGAHGVMEVGLGVQSFLNAETTSDKAMALTTAAHGACLAAAQFTNNALFTIPLYLGMGAATAAQVALSHSAA